MFATICVFANMFARIGLVLQKYFPNFDYTTVPLVGKQNSKMTVVTKSVVFTDILFSEKTEKFRKHFRENGNFRE